MRKIVGIFSLVLMVFLVSACGGKGTDYVQLENLDNINNGKQVVVVSQTTCPACNNFKGDVLTQMDKVMQSKVQVVDVDVVDKEVTNKILSDYKVEFTPTLLLLDQGKLVKSYVGDELKNKEQFEKIVVDFLHK